MGISRGKATTAFCRAAMSACAGIERPVGPMRGGAGVSDLGCDLLSGAEAGIHKFPLFQPPQRRAIGRKALRLTQDGLTPFKPQPGQIGIDRRLELGSAATEIDVFDTQQKAPVRPGGLGSEQRGIDVAQMQPTAGGRSEAADFATCRGGSSGHLSDRRFSPKDG